MWVGIVGSRSLGECACSAQAKSWPPTADEKAHQEECPKVLEWTRMMKIVGRWALREDIEGFVSGGAKGADTLAKGAAELNGFTLSNRKFIEYLPKPGKEPFRVRAFRRNQQIVDKADALVAVFTAGPRTPGTSDTIRKALTKGIPVHIWHNGHWLTE